MPEPNFPTQTTAVAEWAVQIELDGPLFVAGVSNGILLERLYAAGVGPLHGCDISARIPAFTLGSAYITHGDFCDWWQRSGGEGTYSAVVALGWPAKLDFLGEKWKGLPASCVWLLSPGGYFLFDWPIESGRPMVLATALTHVGFKPVGGFDTATHPVYVWQKS